MNGPVGPPQVVTMNYAERNISKGVQLQRNIQRECFHPAGTFIEFPTQAVEGSLHDRFEHQARQFPDRITIKSDLQQVTYQRLNETANRIAHNILSRTDEGREPIALLLDKDSPLLAAALEVLKGGKFYVPLDPSLPEPRVKWLMEDSTAQLVITSDRHHALAQRLAQAKVQVLNLDELSDSHPANNPGLQVPSESLAYLLYTSGTTGESKGVLQTHRDVLRMIMGFTNMLHICPEDRLTLLPPFTFSMAIADTFNALLNGATLYPFSWEEIP